MFKKIALTTLITLVVAALCYAIVRVSAGDEVSWPQTITEESACPVAGCTASDCHAGEPFPEPDGTFVMECPEVEGCTSSECHAWDSLTTQYKSPNNWSMNIWIVAPVIAVIALVLIVKKL